jgi:hypothetical protein
MAEVDPDQEAVLHRLRAAFGFVEVLWVVDHNDGQDEEATRQWRRAGRVPHLWAISHP